jgi:hypothetical protein
MCKGRAKVPRTIFGQLINTMKGKPSTSPALVFERFAADPRAWSIDGPPPQAVWERIQRHYIEPLRAFGQRTGVYLVPSARSCYRSRSYELARGRSGTSWHTFPPASRGACDLVRADGGPMSDVMPAVRGFLPFPSIAWYPANGFIHVDYHVRRKRPGRSLYLCKSPVSEWVFSVTLPEISAT